MTGYVQALPVAIDEGLEQRLVMGDGLQYVGIVGHIADSPLAQPRTTQSEDVTVRGEKEERTSFIHTLQNRTCITNSKVSCSIEAGS